MIATLPTRGGRPKVFALDLHMPSFPQVGTFIYDAGIFIGALVALLKVRQINLWFTSHARLIGMVNDSRRGLAEATQREADLRGASQTLRETASNLSASFAELEKEQGRMQVVLESLRVDVSTLRRINTALVGFARACIAKLTEHKIEIPAIPDDARDTLR